MLAESSINQPHSLLLGDDGLQRSLKALDCFAVGFDPLPETRVPNDRILVSNVSILGLFAFGGEFLPYNGGPAYITVQAQLTSHLVRVYAFVARNHHRRLVNGGIGEARLLVQPIAALLECSLLLFVLFELFVNI